MIRFSIVTPSFNQGTFIERTIRSVLDQQYPHLDYFIVDGASSDDTLSILHRYADRLRFVSESDHGQAEAVNKGICATNGDIIGWLNSDDTYRPGSLLTVAAYFTAHREIDVVYGDANLIDSDDLVIGRYYTEPWNPKRLPQRPFLCQPAVFFRRRVVDRFGQLDNTLHYALDYEYWLRLAKQGARFAYVPYTLADSRVHARTKTLTQGVRAHTELNDVLKRYVEHVPDSWLLTETQVILKEERPRPFSNPLDFAVAVALVSWRLSLEVNHSISPRLAMSTLRTLAAGAVKTALGFPVRPPTE